MNNELYRDRIERKLRGALAPIFLEIKDDSAKHAGHLGHDPRGETHFSLKIVSKSFDNLNRIERHRLVHAALAEELQERIHALQLKLISEDEYNRR